MRGTSLGLGRLVIVAILALGLAFRSSGTGHAGDLPTNLNGKHVMWGMGQGYPSTQQASANNLIYHGGLVETVPAVYLVYWGPAWQNGFTFQHGGFTYTNKTVRNYVNTFFDNVGGTSWAGVQTQYCQN